MPLANNLVINIYSILILIIIYLHSSKHAEKESLLHKLHMLTLQITILMLAVDIFSRFDGKPDTIYPVLNQVGNFLIFLLSPVLPSLWLLYVHVYIFQEKEKAKGLLYPLFAINVINAIMLILSQFFGWYYFIDSDNIYHRGPLFLLAASFPIVLVIAAFLLIIVYRRRIERRYYFPLLFFAIPPGVFIILQILFYGISFILNSVVLSLLIVFLDIQNQNIFTDYLTGVNNRKKLDVYLKEKISASTEDKTFSAIMIDLDNFKSINDIFGHDTGDNVLQVTAKLLNSCLRAKDFIARFGGDEFCIVLDAANIIDLEKIVCRINKCIENYNMVINQPYKVGLSMGYAVYDYHSRLNAEEFQKQLDVLMYENKEARKTRETDLINFIKGNKL